MDPIQQILGQGGFQVAVDEEFDLNIFPQSEAPDDASIFPTTRSQSPSGEAASKETCFLLMNSFRNIEEVYSTITTSGKLACGCCCLPHFCLNFHVGKADQLVRGISCTE